MQLRSPSISRIYYRSYLLHINFGRIEARSHAFLGVIVKFLGRRARSACRHLMLLRVCIWATVGWIASLLPAAIQGIVGHCSKYRSRPGLGLYDLSILMDGRTVANHE